MPIKRVLPIGAELQTGGGVHFRIWAPNSKRAHAERHAGSDSAPTAATPLTAEGNGYFSGLAADFKPGDLYKFRLDGGSFPDPASRFQPFGPHGPSQVIDPGAFRWTDQQWRGLPRGALVMYELHLGTFTTEGSWSAAEQQLPELKRIGITAVEIMPIADFPGDFGWGYDGVNLFAPCRLYGKPDDVRQFVNRAHELGLMVFLDVVYNHLGPDGNYLGQFSKFYVHASKKSEWGDTLNFDGEESAPVREFFLSNVRYWIEEFHFDGLRLDAVQAIHDSSATHILADISRTAAEAGQGRSIIVVAENANQEAHLVRSYERNGYGLHAVWNDDFHHSAMVAATAHADAYYSDFKGSAQELVSVLKYGYLYQGQGSRWLKNPLGTPAFDLKPRNFVNYLQNHDQVANSLRGARLHQLTSPGKARVFTALLLLGPAIPLLFQGQEFSASSPFVYFAHHTKELNVLIREGRTKFIHQFRAIAAQPHPDFPADPSSAETFKSCKLDFSERQRNKAAYQLHEDLLRIRRDDKTIAQPERVDGALLDHDAFLLRFFSSNGEDRLLLVNLGCDLILGTVAEPLLAPLAGCSWKALWSSEAIEYGGGGTAPLETSTGCSIPGHAAVLLGPETKCRSPQS
ncbi:MAG: malto-oligosyltrehalose trehalohydrolase [Nibricoccus sp.]